MGSLECKILAKRQELRDVLVYSVKQTPVSLPMVKELKFKISVCDLALKELYLQRVKAKLG